MAGAGYATSTPDFDRDSIDITFSAGGDFSPKLDAQLKATKRLRKTGDEFKFQLRRKNYDDLRIAHLQTPRVLVVLALHAAETRWLHSNDTRLVIKDQATSGAVI